MALKGSPDVGFCLLEGRRIDNITTAMSHKVAQILDQTDAFGDADEEHTPVSQYMWEATIDGFYDTGAGLAQEGLELTGSQVLMYALFGNAIGDEFVGVDGPRGSITTTMERGKLHRVKADFHAATGPITRIQDIYNAGVPTYESRGMIQAGLQTVTDVGPTNLATLDWAAGNYTDQAIGDAHGFIGLSNLNLDGGTDILFEIQDSADDIAYVNLIVFTALAAIGGETITQVAGAGAAEIERYTQLQYEFQGGAGASRTATFACGLARRYIVL